MRSSRPHASVAALLFVAFALSGCATVGTNRPAPEWVFQPPAADARFEYFVATATSRSGDVEEAESGAAASLLTQINQALGVDVSVLTTAGAKSTLDAYEAELVQQVTQSGAGRVEGLRIADRYVVTGDAVVTVHLLGEYEKAAFERERMERRRLLAEREALLLEPEQRAARAAAQGNVSAALFGYAQAASAAAQAREEGLRIAPAVLERSLQAANELLRGVRIEALGGPVQPINGSAPDEPVLFLITDAQGSPIRGAAVEVSFVERDGARSIVRTRQLTSDQNGHIRFAYPEVNWVGDHVVTARLDSDQVLALINRINGDVAGQANALQTALANTRASYRFASMSRARGVPTAILVVDTDASGLPMPDQRTASGITEALSQAGFSLVSANVDNASIVDQSADELGRYLRSVMPTDIDRAIVGTAEITGYNDSEGYLVRVQATLFAIDLATGELVRSVSGVKNAQSSSASGAINSAFLSLGRALGQELVSSLP